MNKIKIFDSIEELQKNVPLNSIYTLNIEGRSICLTQTKIKFFAFENKCPHYSVPLDTGNINFKGEIVCSLHSYRFNLANGWETTGKKLCLKRYEIKIKDSGVFILIPND